jgi:hypothetical protein
VHCGAHFVIESVYFVVLTKAPLPPVHTQCVHRVCIMHVNKRTYVCKGVARA